MTEQEYIVITNRVRVTEALSLLKAVATGRPCDEYGMSSAQKKTVQDILFSCESRMFKRIEKMQVGE